MANPFEMLVLDSRRKSATSLAKAHGGALVLDVTSRGPEPWVRFSPFYPHGGIPVPFSPGAESESVEGIWQALKVFESADVDRAKLSIRTMRGLKRTVRSHGKVLGHRKGLEGEEILAYVAARRALYLPAYRYVLEHRLANEVERLRELSATRDVVLLDYETNADVEDASRPLSHAALVIAFVEARWPAP